MTPRRRDHFLLKEAHIFFDFLKSEGETVKTQANPSSKKTFFESQRGNFFAIFPTIWRSHDHMMHIKLDPDNPDYRLVVTT